MLADKQLAKLKEAMERNKGNEGMRKEITRKIEVPYQNIILPLFFSTSRYRIETLSYLHVRIEGFGVSFGKRKEGSWYASVRSARHHPPH